LAATALPTAPRRRAYDDVGKAIVVSQFDRAANLINLEDYMRRILMSPFREVQVEVPVRMDDGRIEVFTGYRIQHNGARGRARRHPLPSRGGPRRDPRPGDHHDVEDGPDGHPFGGRRAASR